MRVLTVRQPWAWAIVHGGKDVENRVRNIAGDYRGPVAIHAGLVYDSDWQSALLDDAMRPVRNERGRSVDFPWRRLGVILGVVNLWAVHRDQDGGNCCPHRPVGGPGGSPWSERGAWHLCFNDPRPLVEPIPFRGALGLRTLSADVEAQILAEVS